LQRVFSLRELQPAAHPKIVVFGKYAEHMAVEVAFGARLEAGNRQAEADHTVAVERAERQAADFGRDDKETDRQELDFRKPPDRLLQLHGSFELRLRRERRDLDHGLRSRDLACCHSDSISSIFESAGPAPRSASFFST